MFSKIKSFFNNNRSYCIFCKKRKTEFVFNKNGICACEKCNNSLSIYSEGININLFDKQSVSSPFLYRGIFRKAFLEFKFAECKSYVSVFGYYLNGFIEFMNSETDDELLDDVSYITSIPIPEIRKRERTYNQSELLAREVSKYFKIDYRDNILKRVKDTKRQSTLSAEMRSKNIRGAFCASEEDVNNKKIILIDDICTTGSTLSEAVRVLTDAGAKKVICIVLAIDNIREHSEEYNLLRNTPKKV